MGSFLVVRFRISKSILIVNCFRRAFLYTHATADTFRMVRMLCDIHVHLAGSLTFAAGYTFILIHLHLQKRYFIAKRIDCAQRTYPFTEWAVNIRLRITKVISIPNFHVNSLPRAALILALAIESGIAPSNTPCGQRYLQKNGFPIPSEFVTRRGSKITKINNTPYFI